MANRLPPKGYLLGLDVGDKRIGVALASVIAKLPQPLPHIEVTNNTITDLTNLIAQEDVGLIIIGIPRNLDGQETEQSQKIRDFATELAANTAVPIEFADESLSSVRSEELGREAQFKGISSDSLAACFIVEEFLGNID